MNQNDNNSFYTIEGSASHTYDLGLRAYMLSVYNYMASALALTAIFAYVAANYAPLTNLLFSQQPNGHLALTGLGLVVAFAPLGFVLVLSFGINKLSLPALQATFWTYAAVMGLSMASLFFAYTGASIVSAFLVTAILFGSMSIWGYTSKRDLTGLGHFMMMGLFGIIIASFINFFMGSSAVQFVISILSVVIFTGLTAYDTQQIKSYYYQTSGNTVSAGKAAIMGALRLYLDFINLFVQLLRIFGDRRN